MRFGAAIEALRSGYCVRRAEWPAGTYVFLSAGKNDDPPRAGITWTPDVRMVVIDAAGHQSDMPVRLEDLFALDWGWFQQPRAGAAGSYDEAPRA